MQHHPSPARVRADLVVSASLLVALIDVDAARESMHPSFPKDFAAALETVKADLARVIQDASDLMKADGVPDVPWLPEAA